MVKKSKTIDFPLSELFQTLVEAVPGYSIILLTPQGNISSWNQGSIEITHYTANEIIGKNFSVLYYYESIDNRVPLNPAELFSTDSFSESERWCVRKDGLRFWGHIILFPLYVKDRLVAYGHIIRDWTLQKNILDELQKSEQRLRLMIEANKDYAIIMLDKEGFINTWNSGAERIKGYKKEEIIGKHFSIFYDEKSKKNHHPEYELKMAIEEGRYEEESWRVRKDGTMFWANVIISPIFDADANLIGFGKVTRDLSEQKKIEVLKDQFISVISHELRTPLTSIRGALSLLIGGIAGKLSPKADDLLTIASSNSDRLLHLINDILDIEKLVAGKMKMDLRPTDIGKLVEEAIEINQMFGNQHSVEIIGENILCNIFVNMEADRIMQVLTNLISNAVKFSNVQEKVIVSMKKKSKEILISVTNKGEGIPENFKNKIFDRFAQADSTSSRKKGGSGLGLAISKTIIEKHRGKIYYESQPNQLTTFTIELPIINFNLPQETKSVTGELTKILICEDEKQQATYLKKLLEDAGFVCDVSSTAAQARRLLKFNNYYVLILDLILPDMSGVELIRELHESPDFNVPIIVVSIIANESKQLLSGSAIEIVDWISKPIDFKKLAHAFSKLKVNDKLPRILHVEDDKNIQKLIHNLLDKKAHIVSCVTVNEAFELLQNEMFDLVILDLILEDGNGQVLLPAIANKRIPIIIFAAEGPDLEYSQYVKNILIKSNDSLPMLLDQIQNVLNKHT